MSAVHQAALFGSTFLSPLISFHSWLNEHGGGKTVGGEGDQGRG